MAQTRPPKQTSASSSGARGHITLLLGLPLSLQTRITFPVALRRCDSPCGLPCLWLPLVSHQPQAPQRVVSVVPLLSCVTEDSRERLAREGVRLGTRRVAGILFCNFIVERPDCKSPLPKFQLSSVQFSCVRLSATP